FHAVKRNRPSPPACAVPCSSWRSADSLPIGVRLSLWVPFLMKRSRSADQGEACFDLGAFSALTVFPNSDALVAAPRRHPTRQEPCVNILPRDCPPQLGIWARFAACSGIKAETSSAPIQQLQ